VTTQKTWGGRFTGETDKRVEQFTESISFDRRLFRHDIAASQAHARMLAHVGLLTGAEAERIAAALDEIASEIERGVFAFSTKLEDIHTHIEQALIARLGDVGRKLHTGRSRNDQVATDVKLWVRDALDGVDSRLLDLQRALVEAAQRDRDLVLPGYTHLQRAQPVLAAHYFLAYAEKYQRDRDRLADCRKRVNVLPLGAAALAGTSLPIDRDFVCGLLGFDSVAANSLDVSSDRDFVLEFVFDLTLIALHLAGWAEEWVLWSTTEFGFLALPDAFCTGSSIMPHKKNPDVLELIRGKSARVAAALTQLVLLVKGLPLAYNRDLQEDKEALFDSVDTVRSGLELFSAMLPELTINRERMESLANDPQLLATDLAEYLVGKGVPFREAHAIVGKLAASGKRLNALSNEEFRAASDTFGDDVREVFDVRKALQRRSATGSPSPENISRQIARWRELLETE